MFIIEFNLMKKLVFLSAILMVVMSSCSTYKQMTYKEDDSYNIDDEPSCVYETEDCKFDEMASVYRFLSLIDLQYAWDVKYVFNDIVGNTNEKLIIGCDVITVNNKLYYVENISKKDNKKYIRFGLKKYSFNCALFIKEIKNEKQANTKTNLFTKYIIVDKHKLEDEVNEIYNSNE